MAFHIIVLIWVSAAVFPVELLDDAPGKAAESGLSSWTCANHVGDAAAYQAPALIWPAVADVAL